ncbi:beta-lactamase/transpeptidase-like protein [Nemania sp. FL0916]|nr:beta-lactamase/transpeptidase-like protein [Nemania sp. FL0916]
MEERKKDMQERLHGRIPAMHDILKITGQPGLSVGVIYQGEEIFKHNIGNRSVEACLLVDSDTLFCIGSLSLAFMSTSLDLLSRDHGLSWDQPVAKIIPEFRNVNQPTGFKGITIKDILSHTTGFESLDEITQGLNGRILVAKKDLVEVCNALLFQQHKLRSRCSYNNAMYALAGEVVERISGQNWGEFQRDRIFKPLGMDRTTAFDSVHEADGNIAKPYMTLSDGTLFQTRPTELSAESMNGGSGGIRSSVNDLLKWCKCQFRAFEPEPESEDLSSEKPFVVRRGSPVFEPIVPINSYSTRPSYYCAGWCHHRTPGALGLISPNRALATPAIGKDKRPLRVFGHQGDVPGYTCNLYIIPSTKSAIVVLSNGTGLSDATDWIAQDLIQTMHSMSPRIDFVELAQEAREKYLTQYETLYCEPLRQHRRQRGNTPSPLEDFIGTYYMNNLKIVFIEIKRSEKDANKLAMLVNGYADQALDLWHYHFDVFCHLPESLDACLRAGFYRSSWENTLIEFQRDDKGQITSLTWKLNSMNIIFSRGETCK